MSKQAQPQAQPNTQPAQPAQPAPNAAQEAAAQSHIAAPGTLDPYKVAEGKTGKDAVMTPGKPEKK